MDKEFESLAIDELYLDRVNAYSWINNDWKKHLMIVEKRNVMELKKLKKL